jgi:hypothetical protein
MFKKLNFKTLLIVFGSLLVLVVILKVVQHNKGDRNFKAKFFDVDTAKVSTIIILPHSTKEEFKFVRNGKRWSMVKKDKTYNVDNNAVASILVELQNMKPDFVAAMDKSDWHQYQVTDSSATRVKVKQGAKTVADFFVGKASFKQYEQTSYIRLAGDDDVYAVNGLLAMTFNREANDFRDKTMVRIGSSAFVNKMEFSYPDSSFTLTKEKTGWSMNGVKADSAKVASYVNNIIWLNGADFVDDSVVSGNQIFSLKVEGNNFNPVELKAFIANAANQYVVTSSMNNEGRFSGVKGDLVKRVFVGLNHFKPTTKKEEKLKGRKGK